MVVPDGVTLTGSGSVRQGNDGSLISSFALEKSDSKWRVVYSSDGIKPESIQLAFSDGKRLISDSWRTTKTQLPWNAASKQTIVDGMLSKCTLLPQATNIEERPSAYVFYLTNFLFSGTQVVTTKFGKGTKGTLSRIDLDIDNYEVSLNWVPNYDRITQNIRDTRGIDVTAKLHIRTPKKPSTEEIYDLVDNICALLSLASGNNVVWVEARTYGRRGQWISSELLHGVTRPYSSMSLLDLNQGSNIKSLVERGLPMLVEWDRRLATGANTTPLRNAIRLSLDSARGGTYLQSRGLAAVIVIELLSSRLAATVGAEKLIPSRKFSKIRKRIRNLLREISPKVGIDSLVTDQLANKISELNRPSFQVGISRLVSAANLIIEDAEIKRFLEVRNALVHTGDFSSKNGINPVDQFFEILEFADRILLAMLGYKGDYLSATSGWKSVGLNVQPSQENSKYPAGHMEL